MRYIRELQNQKQLPNLLEGHLPAATEEAHFPVLLLFLCH